MGQAVLIESMSKKYGIGPSTITALDNVSLSFPVGSFTAVMGPSGSGKSTLLQCAAGLDRPSSGKVTEAGTPGCARSGTESTELPVAHLQVWIDLDNVRRGGEPFRALVRVAARRLTRW